MRFDRQGRVWKVVPIPTLRTRYILWKARVTTSQSYKMTNNQFNWYNRSEFYSIYNRMLTKNVHWNRHHSTRYRLCISWFCASTRKHHSSLSRSFSTCRRSHQFSLRYFRADQQSLRLNCQLRSCTQIRTIELSAREREREDIFHESSVSSRENRI